MDIISSEWQNHMCKKHPTQQLLFINTNLKDIKGMDSVYFCDFCLSDDNALEYKDIISIKQIIDQGDKNINQKWPPVNNYEVLKELIRITQQGLNRDAIYTSITDCFTELKKEIMQQLDKLQKKIIHKISDSLVEFEQTFETYLQISKIDQFRTLLIENQKKNMSKTEDLKQFIQSLQFQKENNNYLLEQLLNKSKKLVEQLSGQYEVTLKDSITSYLKTLNSFFISRKDKELQISEKIKYSKDNEKEKQKKLYYINKEAINAITGLSDFGRFQSTFVIKNMIHSDFSKSKDICVLQDKGIISLIPRTENTSGQLYSENKIDQYDIYEFIITFSRKPTSYICIGFEEEEHKNRYLGGQGKNSFALGQQNSLFCSKLIKGSKNLQELCEEEFVETIAIQVLLSENKFYITDYPQKRVVNCMDDSLYQFKPDKDYYFTIQIQSQNTQVDIISSRVKKFFTIV